MQAGQKKRCQNRDPAETFEDFARGEGQDEAGDHRPGGGMRHHEHHRCRCGAGGRNPVLAAQPGLSHVDPDGARNVLPDLTGKKTRAAARRPTGISSPRSRLRQANPDAPVPAAAARKDPRSVAKPILRAASSAPPPSATRRQTSTPNADPRKSNRARSSSCRFQDVVGAPLAVDRLGWKLLVASTGPFRTVLSMHPPATYGSRPAAAEAPWFGRRRA